MRSKQPEKPPPPPPAAPTPLESAIAEKALELSLSDLIMHLLKEGENVAWIEARVDVGYKDGTNRAVSVVTSLVGYRRTARRPTMG